MSRPASARSTVQPARRTSGRLLLRIEPQDVLLEAERLDADVVYRQVAHRRQPGPERAPDIEDRYLRRSRDDRDASTIGMSPFTGVENSTVTRVAEYRRESPPQCARRPDGRDGRAQSESQVFSTSDRTCDERNTVVSPARFSSSSVSMNASIMSGSRPAVGSSSTRTGAPRHERLDETELALHALGVVAHLPLEIGLAHGESVKERLEPLRLLPAAARPSRGSGGIRRR